MPGLVLAKSGKLVVEVEQVGPFRIVRRLGNKRQRVFEAYQEEQNRTVALKFITLPPDVSRERALRKIQREVRFLQRLQHPHLTTFYGAGIVEDRVFFAMELVEGESLATILSRRGRIAWDLALDYAIQIAEVLSYLHEQELLHSKLTPEKILIRGGQVKVADLRMNRARRRRWDAKKREDLEVAAYLAPEQLLGEGATHHSDLYSLGAIIFEMVTGKMPYPPESLERMAGRKRLQKVEPLSRHVVDCPVWLDQVVDTLMQPESRLRYPSARAAILAMREIQKIDANKTSTVAQVAGGFNALTAGVDKREARSLLGKKEPSPQQIARQKKRNETPLYVQTWMLVVGLIAASVALGGAFYMMMPSFDREIAWAQRVLENPDAEVMEMRNVEFSLKRLVARSPDDPQAKTVNQLLEDLQIKRLMRLARRGNVGLQDPTVKKFIGAYQADVKGEYQQSLEGYRSLLEDVSDDDPEEGFMYREALRQMVDVREKFAKKMQAELQEATTVDDQTRSIRIAVAIKQELGNSLAHREWVTAVERQFPKLAEIQAMPILLPASQETAEGSPNENPSAGSPETATEQEPGPTSDDRSSDSGETASDTPNQSRRNDVRDEPPTDSQ